MKQQFRNYDEYPSLLGASDLENIFPISRAGIYNLMNSEGFPIINIGKRKVVPKEALINWIEQNTCKQIDI